MKINEVFLSCQGEGVNIGLPVMFVRFQGCSLRPLCSWCDTKYAQADGGERLTLEQLMERIVEVGASTCCERFCITGGEPLDQELEVIELVRELQADGVKHIEVFTSGSLPPPVWYERVQWCVDVKCPSSRTRISSDSYDKWFRLLGRSDSVKFVVADHEDLDYCEFVTRSISKVRGPQVVVNPMFPPVPSSLMIDVLVSQRPWYQEVWDFCVAHNFRWSFQQHKLVFGNKRGV